MYLIIFYYLTSIIFFGLIINNIITIHNYYNDYSENILYHGFIYADNIRQQFYLKYEMTKLFFYILIFTILILSDKFNFYIQNNKYLI